MENNKPTIKDLIKDNIASFSYMLVSQDTLVYKLNYMGFTYEFGIPISDLGEATVSQTEKAITLMRYLRKAMEKDQLIKHTMCTPYGYSATESAIYSHYRAGIAYYQINEDGKNYSFPIRKEDMAEIGQDKLYLTESKTILYDVIKKAKEANEFHPC